MVVVGIKGRPSMWIKGRPSTCGPENRPGCSRPNQTTHPTHLLTMLRRHILTCGVLSFAHDYNMKCTWYGGGVDPLHLLHPGDSCNATCWRVSKGHLESSRIKSLTRV